MRDVTDDGSDSDCNTNDFKEQPDWINAAKTTPIQTGNAQLVFYSIQTRMRMKPHELSIRAPTA